MGDPFAVHAVIIDADLLAFGDAVYQRPKIILDAPAIVTDLRVVIQLLADQLVELRTILRSGEAFELFDQLLLFDDIRYDRIAYRRIG